MLGTTAGSGKSLYVRSFASLRRRAGHEVSVYKPVALALNPIREDPEVDRSIHLMGIAATGEVLPAERILGYTATVDGEDVSLRRAGETSASAQSRRLSEDAVDFMRLGDDQWSELTGHVATDLAARTGFLLSEGAGAATDATVRDLSNTMLADMADRPVVLVAAGRKGGWAASVVGTFHLLPATVRSKVRGFIVNGVEQSDAAAAAVRHVETSTGWQCLGVVPIIPLYAQLPARGSEEPILGSWGEEIAAVADFVAAHLDGDFLKDFTSRGDDV
ncbi:AAA family ATPase [Streptomyces parvus]|uniref:AAA family ATPase n=1 Tax=Streptomyces parvus TaxID=66428 RepID=A0A7K3RWJ2_9ACTN|nr:AAA family ATPase [Streptomyces parvus]